MMAQGSAQLAGAVKEFGLLDFPFIRFPHRGIVLIDLLKSG
jgi:hypothetical protein